MNITATRGHSRFGYFILLMRINSAYYTENHPNPFPRLRFYTLDLLKFFHYVDYTQIKMSSGVRYALHLRWVGTYFECTFLEPLRLPLKEPLFFPNTDTTPYEHNHRFCRTLRAIDIVFWLYFIHYSTSRLPVYAVRVFEYKIIDLQ